MKIIGLTGGMGSGKSLICQLFEQLNVPCFVADKYGRSVLDEDPGVRRSIEAMFGSEIYTQGKADRKRLAERVFSDPKALDRLNAIVHPAVKRAFDVWYEARKLEGKSAYCVRESAILFESGLNNDCHATIAVIADESLRIQRVLNRDGVSKDDVRQRMMNQLSDNERAQRADFIIDNNGDAAIIPQVLNLHLLWNRRDDLVD